MREGKWGMIEREGGREKERRDLKKGLDFEY